MNKLKLCRERAELTQVELAKRTGFEQALISKVEAGGRDLKGQQWKLVASVLNCSTDELLGVVK